MIQLISEKHRLLRWIVPISSPCFFFFAHQEQEKWEKEDDKQRQFRLTDTIEDVQQRKDEDARVEKELAGDFSAEDLVSAGIHQPEDRPPGRKQGSHHDEF